MSTTTRADVAFEDEVAASIAELLGEHDRLSSALMAMVDAIAYVNAHGGMLNDENIRSATADLLRDSLDHVQHATDVFGVEHEPQFAYPPAETEGSD